MLNERGEQNWRDARAASDETIEERLTGVPAVDDMLMLRHHIFHEVGKGGASFVQLWSAN